MKYLIIFIIIAGVAYYLINQDSGATKTTESKQQMGQTTATEVSVEEKAKSEWDWLKNVKGKPLSTKKIIALSDQAQTKSYAYVFKASNVGVTKETYDRYKNRKTCPFRIAGGLYSGPKGSTLKPNYNGQVNIFIIDTKTKKIAAKRTISLKQFCFT